jgi:hypothetical protein
MPPLLHLAALGATVLFVGLLAVYAAIYLQDAFDAIRYPYDLDYGEGIVWQQALLIPGARMYGAITQAPFIVFHYPPVYHLAVRALASFGLDPLLAGRALSVVCTLAAAWLGAWIVERGTSERAGRSARAIGCAIAGLLPLSLGPVEYWSVLMRVDMLALFLSFLGVALVVESIRRPGWLALALPIFVLAVYTKQTALAAPAAALAVSLAVNRRPTVIATAFGAALGLAALGWLEWTTGGGFLRHIVAYNINRFSIEALVGRVLSLQHYAFLFLAAIVALALLWRDERPAATSVVSPPNPRARAVVAIVTLWLALAAAILTTVGKSGAAVNYFIEFFYICALPIGMLAAHCWHDIVAKRARSAGADVGAILLCLPVGLAAQLVMDPPFRYPRLDDPRLTLIQRSLVQEIARAKQPVLSEDMVLLLRAGREVPIEPTIFKELAAVGTWDQTPFLQLLTDRSFAFLVIMKEDRYTPEMLAAIAQAYPRIDDVGPYTIRH